MHKRKQKESHQMSEAKIAAQLIGYLTDQGWDLYQEVEIDGRRADIIAIMRPKVWIIEVKLHYGLKVLEQAMFWRGLCHYVSVAIPRPNRWRILQSNLISRVHAMTGIGLLNIGSYGVDELYSSALNRKADISWVKRLCPEHKTYAKAGTNDGGYFTAFAATKKEFTAFVHCHPGLTMKEIIDHLGRLHYANMTCAKTALAHWIIVGHLPGVARRQEGNKVRYYLSEAK